MSDFWDNLNALTVAERARLDEVQARSPEERQSLRQSDGGKERTADQPSRAYLDLTDRELQVLRGVAAGLSNAEIGAELCASSESVKTQVAMVLRKLDARTRANAVWLGRHLLEADE